MSENLRPADVTEGELQWFRCVVSDRDALREQVQALHKHNAKALPYKLMHPNWRCKPRAV